MRLFSKPDPERAPAAMAIRFSAAGSIAVDWVGDTSLLLRTPAIYLDWALNKDQRHSAQRTLQLLGLVFEEATPDNSKISELLGTRTVGKDVEVVIAITEEFRADVSFRPRMAAASHLYATFSALWNALMDELTRVGDHDAIEGLLDDMREQLSLHREIGLGMRGGVAPMLAGQRGAGRRLEREIADYSGLDVEQFRALSDGERDRLIERHALASLSDSASGASLDDQGPSVTQATEDDAAWLMEHELSALDRQGICWIILRLENLEPSYEPFFYGGFGWAFAAKTTSPSSLFVERRDFLERTALMYTGAMPVPPMPGVDDARFNRLFAVVASFHGLRTQLHATARRLVPRDSFPRTSREALEFFNTQLAGEPIEEGLDEGATLRVFEAGSDFFAFESLLLLALRRLERLGRAELDRIVVPRPGH